MHCPSYPRLILQLNYEPQTQSPFMGGWDGGRGSSPLSKLKKKHEVSEVGCASSSSKEAPNLVRPLDRGILSHWAYNIG